jgi:hypothetical protein
MELTQRVARTWLGIMLAVLLGALIAPLAVLHPRPAHPPVASYARK